MPDFRPRVQPRLEPDRNYGEEFAGAIESFQDARDRAREREAFEEDRQYLQGQREREAVTADLSFQKLLEEQGLAPATPRAIEKVRDQEPHQFDDRPLTEGRGIGMTDRPELPRTSIVRDTQQADPRQLFAGVGAAGPEALDRPVLLPGQFSAGVGFSPRTMYMQDVIPSAGAVQEQLQERPRVNLGGREFERVGPTATERDRIEAREAIDRTIAAGVPRSIAELEDQTLNRSYLEPDEEAIYSPEDLQSVGISPELSAVAANDPVLARQLIANTQRGVDDSTNLGRDRFNREIAIENLESAALSLFGQGLDAQTVLDELGAIPEFRGIATPARIQNLQQEATRLYESGREPSDQTTERRRELVAALGRSRVDITEPWMQEIVDMLAGIGPDGGDAAPRSPEQVRAGYTDAGTPPESMRAIDTFLRRVEEINRTIGRP